ncbi:hypothetical protein [Bacillus mycoides]|uniref:hypothetical protein n=1 Tax=Bacillus mycoides TaxID=1405 RepID=UPI003A7F8B87
MSKERWVIKTNKGRYVGIPYMMRGGFRSFLHAEPVWNKTRTFDTRKEAETELNEYLTPTSNYYIDRDTFTEGEKLEGAALVILNNE